jgi:hypothetical protein
VATILCVFSCITVTVSAQDLLNAVFSKSLEYVNTNNKNEWYKGQILNKTRNGMGLCKWKDGTLYNIIFKVVDILQKNSIFVKTLEN